MLGKDARLCVRGSGSRRPASAFSAAQVPSGFKGRAAWSHPRPRPFRARLLPAPPVRLDCPAGNCARPAGVGRAPRPVSMETACQPPSQQPTGCAAPGTRRADPQAPETHVSTGTPRPLSRQAQEGAGGSLSFNKGLMLGQVWEKELTQSLESLDPWVLLLVQDLRWSFPATGPPEALPRFPWGGTEARPQDFGPWAQIPLVTPHGAALDEALR